MKVGRIQVKFDNVPLVNVANKFDEDGRGSVGGSGGGRNGY
jgi:hypothetical protein